MARLTEGNLFPMREQGDSIARELLPDGYDFPLGRNDDFPDSHYDIISDDETVSDEEILAMLKTLELYDEAAASSM